MDLKEEIKKMLDDALEQWKRNHHNYWAGYAFACSDILEYMEENLDSKYIEEKMEALNQWEDELNKYYDTLRKLNESLNKWNESLREWGNTLHNLNNCIEEAKGKIDFEKIRKNNK